MTAVETKTVEIIKAVEMKMWIAVGVAVISLVAASSASAQSTDSSSVREHSKFSVEGGIGFAAEDNFDGFLLNFGGLYRLTNKISAGVDFQLAFDDDGTVFSMPFYGRYDFGDLPVDVAILKEMHPFAKAGLGFTYVDPDAGKDDTGFLFLIGGGVSYPISESLSVESVMQFNITTNDAFQDDFYFSWEMVALRYHF